MKKEIIYTLESPYRENLDITAYRFGSGEKAACIVGSIRGNEVQQLYVCSQLIKKLKKLEEQGIIVANKEIMVIPSVNHFSMNIGKRFWAVDNTDINRMFPGYNQGETTQRIASGVFEQVKEYEYGIQFASFYLPGDFMPHMRMMETGYQDPELADQFGLPYTVIKKPQPIDTTTLNYNWQVWETKAFSVYTCKTDEIDEVSASQAVSAVLRFLDKQGIIEYKCHGGFVSSIVRDDELLNLKTKKGGIYRRIRKQGEEVHEGEVIAEILDPYEGEVISQIISPIDGVVFFSHKKPLVTESEIVYKIIKKLHE